jgi:uncharacterized protein YoxC
VLAATSDTGRLEAIIVTVAATVVILALFALLLSLAKTLRAVRAATEELNHEVKAVLGRMQGTLGQAGAELDRVDGLLGAAESISSTVDSASRLAYETFSNPVIKVLAFGTGTRRAARRFRRRQEE